MLRTRNPIQQQPLAIQHKYKKFQVEKFENLD